MPKKFTLDFLNKICNDKNIIHRFTIGFWDNKVYDYSKYLKKI